MAFSEDDLKFLHEDTSRRNRIAFFAIFITLALLIAGVFMRSRKPQPIRVTAPIAARPAVTPTMTNANRTPTEINVIQQEYNISITSITAGNTAAPAKKTPASRPAPTPVATGTAPRSRRVQPAPAAPLINERKVLTRADLDAELARRNEQNARDKAEVDRLNTEKEAAKQERMRLAEKREREERLERLRQQRARIHRRTWHYHIPEKDKSQARLR